MRRQWGNPFLFYGLPLQSRRSTCKKVGIPFLSHWVSFLGRDSFREDKIGQNSLDTSEDLSTGANSTSSIDQRITILVGGILRSSPQTSSQRRVNRSSGEKTGAGSVLLAKYIFASARKESMCVVCCRGKPKQSRSVPEIILMFLSKFLYLLWRLTRNWIYQEQIK